ncbi:MAG: N-acyl homoserine lactonase family protein [Thermodesulfobacteriota bacterium]
MREYTIHPLAVGINETDQGVMTYLKDYGKRIWLPIYVFAIKGGDKNILVDTGLSDFVVPEAAVSECGFAPMDFSEALATVGLAPEDIDVVIHTHLHNDHCENDQLCENAEVIVQKAELDYFNDPPALDHRIYPDVLDGVNVRTVEGDVPLFDGISVLHTPGHTPGGQSIVVNTSAGRALITGFCANEKNFPSVGPAVTPGVHTDALAAYRSVQRVKAFAPEILIPLHAVSVGRKKSIP